MSFFKSLFGCCDTATTSDGPGKHSMTIPPEKIDKRKLKILRKPSMNDAIQDILVNFKFELVILSKVLKGYDKNDGRKQKQLKRLIKTVENEVVKSVGKLY